MKSMRFAFFAALSLVAALVAAPAQAAPIVSYTVGDASATNVELTRAGKQYTFGHGAETGDYVVTMSGMLDPDPLISFLIGVTNLTTNDVVFTFVFNLPFSQPVTNAIGTSSLSGGLPDGGSLTAVNPSVMMVRLNGNDVGLDVGPDADPFELPLYGPFNAGPVALGGPYDQLTTTLAFTLSGGASASLNGSVLIEPVPEPATLTLLGLALCTVAARRRPRA